MMVVPLISSFDLRARIILILNQTMTTIDEIDHLRCVRPLISKLRSELFLAVKSLAVAVRIRGKRNDL